MSACSAEFCFGSFLTFALYLVRLALTNLPLQRGLNITAFGRILYTDIKTWVWATFQTLPLIYAMP